MNDLKRHYKKIKKQAVAGEDIKKVKRAIDNLKKKEKAMMKKQKVVEKKAKKRAEAKANKVLEEAVEDEQQ